MNNPSIDTQGNKLWHNELGQIHREDAPAYESVSGTKYWCINGKLHREDAPAYESISGTKYWCINGKLHRIDGPAVIRPYGEVEYWLNGKQYYSLEEGLMDYVLY